MGCIYKMTNKVNGKIYIGQTRTSLTERMRKHYSDARCEDGVTGIDAAIRKYGENAFKVEVLCECDDSELNEREIAYIAEFDCYNTDKGYNLTPGGQLSSTWLNLDESAVIQAYKELKSVKDTAEKFHCSDKTISNILHKHDVEIYRPGRVENILNKGKKFQEGDGVKAVRIVELDKTFPSLKECAKWLIDTGYSKASTMELARKSLSRALHGDRDTYCRLHFEFV